MRLAAHLSQVVVALIVAREHIILLAGDLGDGILVANRRSWCASINDGHPVLPVCIKLPHKRVHLVDWVALRLELKVPEATWKAVAKQTHSTKVSGYKHTLDAW